MEVTFWPGLRDGIIKFFTDMKFFFTKDFIKQNYSGNILFNDRNFSSREYFLKSTESGFCLSK